MECCLPRYFVTVSSLHTTTFWKSRKAAAAGKIILSLAAAAVAASAAAHPYPVGNLSRPTRILNSRLFCSASHAPDLSSYQTLAQPLKRLDCTVFRLFVCFRWQMIDKKMGEKDEQDSPFSCCSFLKCIHARLCRPTDRPTVRERCRDLC